MSDVVCGFHQLVQDAKNFLKKYPQEKKVPIPYHQEMFFSQAKEKKIPPPKSKTFSQPSSLRKPQLEKEKPVLDKKPILTPEPPLKEKIVSSLPDKEEDLFKDLVQMTKKIAPDYLLHTSLPDDKEAQHFAKIWKYQNLSFALGVIFFHEEIYEKQFLRNIAKAIDLYLIPCRLIDGSFLEKENGWSTFFSSQDLKLVIMPERVQHTLSYFLKNKLVWDDVKKSFFLEGVEVLLLKDFSFYSLHPKEKALLWENFKRKVAPLKGFLDGK